MNGDGGVGQSRLGPARLADLVAGAPDGVLVVAHDGRIAYANAEAERLFGYGQGALVGLPVEELLPPEYRAVHEAHRGHYSAAPATRPMGSGLDLRGLRSDGNSFPVDISLSPLEVEGSIWVTAFVRDVSEARRAAARSSAVAELTQALLRGTPMREVLKLIAEQARLLLEASICWVLGEASEGLPRVLAASGASPSGEEASELVGTTAAPASAAAAASASDEAVLAADLSGEGDEGREPPGPWQGLGPALYAPLRAEEQPFGVLCVARRWGAPGFSPADMEVLRRFADQAALALKHAELRSDLEELRLAADRERIARDLHDTVIQSLFATGMGLQATLSRVQAFDVRERIERAIDDLDGVVRAIRSTIFELQSPREGSLRRLVLDMAGDASSSLGFVPEVRFEGPVDITVPEAVAADLLPTLREALSNAARHARATSVQVLVAVGDELLLEVRDDGVGLGADPAGQDPEAREGGNGLENMRQRAKSLGGSCALEPAPGRGAVLRWRVPLGS